MSPVCTICRKEPATRIGRRFCQTCHQRHIAGGGRRDLPIDSAELAERERRIERMRLRAELKLPLFE
jgi:hypothetical protein